MDIGVGAIGSLNIQNEAVTAAKIAPGTPGDVLTTNDAFQVVWATPTSVISTDGTVAINQTGNVFDLSVPGSTDDQNLTAATLSGTDLTISIENGDPVVADLSDFALQTDVVAAINAYDATDLDKSATNEIQNITSGDGSITINQTGNDFDLSVPSLPTGTSGSVFFSNGAGLDENNSQFYWDNTNTRLGIGTDNPAVELHVALGQVRAVSFAGEQASSSASTPTYRFNTGTNNDGMFMPNDDEIGFSTAGIEAMRIIANRNVGINIALPVERLHVVGNIRADGDFISNNTAIQVPDYVFQSYFTGTSVLKPDYQMPSLSEVREFVAKHHHLPGVTSAEEVKAQGGIILNHATTQNLEKIEELFLHTLEQQEQIDALKKENAGLSKELEDMKLRMARIEEALNQKSGE